MGGMNAFFAWGEVTRVRLLVALALLTGLVGCGDDVTSPPRTDLPYELYCDIANGNCQVAIYNSVAAKLEATGFAPPKLRTISVEQHADEIRSSIDLQNLTGEDASSRGLRLLGFLPEAVSLYKELQVEEMLRGVARIKNVALGTVEAELERVIELCDLGAVRHRLIGFCSRGYRQRIGLAQAMLGQSARSKASV